MTLQEFYRLLENHDWFYAYSDDHSVWKKGAAQRNQITSLTATDRDKYELYAKYRDHVYFDGPKPEKPE